MGEKVWIEGYGSSVHWAQRYEKSLCHWKSFEEVGHLRNMEDKPTVLLPHRVDGTIVCVEVVEMEEENKDDEAGKHEWGDRNPEFDSNDNDKAVFDSSFDEKA